MSSRWTRLRQRVQHRADQHIEQARRRQSEGDSHACTRHRALALRLRHVVVLMEEAVDA